MLALSRHLLSCRESCEIFGRQVRVQCLHPNADDPRLCSPCPTLTISSRVGPTMLRSEAEALDGTSLDAARNSLERVMMAASASDDLDDAEDEIRAEALRWFSVHFARVYRVLRGRQRYSLAPTDVHEQVELFYAIFWREAAALFEPGRRAAEPATAVEAAAAGSAAEGGAPLSALITVASEKGVGEESAFRRLAQSIQLGLASLQLVKEMRISVIHPVDTFQVLDEEDGGSSWAKTLRYPLLHVTIARPVS